MIAPVPMYSPLPTAGYTGRTAARSTALELTIDPAGAAAAAAGPPAAPLVPSPLWGVGRPETLPACPFRRTLLAMGFVAIHTEARVGGDPRWSIHSGRRVDGTIARLTEEAGRLAMIEVETRECDELVELEIGEAIERAFRSQRAAV